MNAAIKGVCWALLHQEASLGIRPRPEPTAQVSGTFSVHSSQVHRYVLGLAAYHAQVEDNEYIWCNLNDV